MYCDKKLQIYNTLSRSVEEFTSLLDAHVTMYHCGPTVYWTQHIGNLRAVVMADVVVRSLTYFGYTVELVRNYTDVGHLTSDEDLGEDKIDTTARKEGRSPKEIARYYAEKYDQDVTRLNVLPPAHTPRATDHITTIIEMISQLEQKGFAYATPLALYFDTTKVSDYTKLSHQDLAETREGAGSGTVQDKDKRNPHDFALWFFKRGSHEQALQTWDSPFKPSDGGSGEGFPGWHIECSAMSRHFLGATLDIHMGGIEHVPVHHTNEIAQSEAANGVPFANYWLHNEHLLVDGRKMSKSEGTSYSLGDVVSHGSDPLALRYLFLQSHYRSKQNFTWDSLSAAENGLINLYRNVAALGDDVGQVSASFKELFLDALADDFNTPKALGVVTDLLQSDLSNQDKRATIIDFDSVLGLALDQRSLLYKPMSLHELPSEVQRLIEQRNVARRDRKWEEADHLRDDIQALGFTVQDMDGQSRVYLSKQ